jgi:tetratricopeptide (TPR) repeat protein
MRAGFIALLLIASLPAKPLAAFQQVVHFPRVYGDTGRPYGPTQANYQYERRYGRTWHGVGGATTVVSPTRRIYAPYSYSPLTVYGPVIADYYSGYGGYGLPSYAGYAPVYGYAPVAPTYVPVVPQYVAPPFFNNEVIQRGLLENDLRWNQPLQFTPAPPNNARKPEPSNTAAILKSLRAQSNGDFLFQRQDYHGAYQRYHQAVRAAPDRAEANFRLAFALTALSRFDSAVAYFKRGLRLDPKWPVTGASLGRIFGRHNELAKTDVLGKVTRWVKEDIRDPDRLFLLGVLLHFDNDNDKSAVLFEAAYRLAGGGDHLKAFLLAGKQASVKKPAAKPKAVPPAPAPKQDEAPPKPGIKAKPPQGPILPPLPKP